MQTKFAAHIALLLAILGFAAPAQGQEPVCKDGETVGNCFERLTDELTNAGNGQTGDAGDTEEEELQGKATGPNVNEDLAQSAIRDFLPRFAGSLLTSDPTKDLRALDFRFNTPLGRNGSAPRITLQGGITLHAAELYAPLIDSIPESIRETSREQLSEDLEDGDDATGFVTLNLESRRLGRNFANHQEFVDRLATMIADSAREEIGAQPQAIDAFVPFSTRLGNIESIDPRRRRDPACVKVLEQPLRPHQAGNLPVGCLTAEVRTELETLFTQMSQHTARLELEISSLLSDAGFDRISELVNNQPQLNISAEYRNRLNIVGPNEWTGRARFEMGFANMNGLRRHCARESQRNSAAQIDSLACLRKYTGSPSVQRSLARSDRLWLAAEARYRPEYQVELADDSVNFSLGSGVGFGVSGGYGRYLGSAESDEADRDRIDLHLSYDHADGEDLRQSRFLAGLFYTLRISGNASGVVGLAWANKPEFVEGADRQLHANLGLSYKFNRGTKDKD